MDEVPMIPTLRWQRTVLGVASMLMASACTMEPHGGGGGGGGGGGEPDQAPIATDDSITTPMNTPIISSVLANDKDPDDDALAVASYTQGAHGVVEFGGEGGVEVKYMPNPGFTGVDSFRYTIDDGHGLSAVGVVTVMVSPLTPGCTIDITGPAAGTFGENLHLTANATCNTGPAQVQWFHKVNSSYVVVQAYSTTQTLDLPADVVGGNLFYALVRTQGTSSSQGMSNIVTVKAVDNTPQCTLVKMVSPTNTQSLRAGMAQPLTASATCPAGSVPEYQFWVKPAGAASWTILPSYTTGSQSWVPPATGSWSIRAVVRTVGSHVSYQMASMSVTVNVTS
jgi:hypothetical protein